MGFMVLRKSYSSRKADVRRLLSGDTHHIGKLPRMIIRTSDKNGNCFGNNSLWGCFPFVEDMPKTSLLLPAHLCVAGCAFGKKKKVLVPARLFASKLQQNQRPSRSIRNARLITPVCGTRPKRSDAAKAPAQARLWHHLRG